jgi:hypothetical protein
MVYKQLELYQILLMISSLTYSILHCVLLAPVQMLLLIKRLDLLQIPRVRLLILYWAWMMHNIRRMY